MKIDLYIKDGYEDKLFFDVEPLKKTRKWMDDIKESEIYKCLPLRIGNEIGWAVKSKFSFECEWNGEAQKNGIKGSIKISSKYKNQIDYYKKKSFNKEILDFKYPSVDPVNSHFGHGIITFNLPWVIRTPKGWGIYVRGPTNSYKEGVLYMDGYIETDWLNNSFTYNVKIQNKNKKIVFNEGEELFSFIPYKIHDLKNTKLVCSHIKKTNPYLNSNFKDFWIHREMLVAKNAEDMRTTFDLDYFKGGIKNDSATSSVGCPFKHLTVLNLKNLELNLQAPEFTNKKNFLTFLKNIRESVYKVIWFFKKFIPK